jgi:uncharacterized repeat protein (TIGR03803 family)
MEENMRLERSRLSIFVKTTEVLAAFALLLATAQAQQFNVLYRFSGPDGSRPDAGVTRDAAGNLYGTAFVGGSGYGTAFVLKHKGSAYVFDLLYTFTGGADGANPLSRVVFGPQGLLYGSASAGGITTCQFQGLTGCGTLFTLRPPVTFCRTVRCPWTETVIHSFSGGVDGWQPNDDLIFDTAGNMYGIASDGGLYGNCNGFPGCGVAFKFTRSGNSWNESVLWNFGQGIDGVIPIGGLVFDTSGNLYGETYAGGASGFGTVYRLTPSGSGWMENILNSFTDGADGSGPTAGAMVDGAGNVYATTHIGGAGGGGTPVKLTPSNGGWTYSLMASFTGTFGPRFGHLAMDQAGNLYGTTQNDGAFGYGSVFKLVPTGGGYTYVSLYDFTGGSDGAQPKGNLTFDSTGNIYGTTAEGGNLTSTCNNGAGCGVVWELTP